MVVVGDLRPEKGWHGSAGSRDADDEYGQAVDTDLCSPASVRA
jgi:hypothetical protein